MTTVLLVDDQQLLRTGFRMVLEEVDGIEIVGEASDGVEAIALVRQLDPDVVLMDVRMQAMDGIEATKVIVKQSPRSKVLILTTFDLDEYAFSALRYGASGFLLKDVPPTELVAAIQAIALGDAVVSPRITRQLLDAYAHRLPGTEVESNLKESTLQSLTTREREVMLEVARGLSNSEIAEKLYVAEATVKTHFGRVLMKLGLRDRVQVVVLAYECGLVQPDQWNDQ